MPMFKYFRDLVYYSFEHEIDAFIKQCYYLLSYLNRNNDKNELLKYVKILKYYKPSKSLKEFDSDKFINNFNLVKDGETFLIFLTNEFNKTYNGDNVIDINKYYKDWETHFHKAGIEYEERIHDVIEEVIKNYKKINEEYIHETRDFIDIKIPETINIDTLIFEKIKQFIKNNI